MNLSPSKFSSWEICMLLFHLPKLARLVKPTIPKDNLGELDPSDLPGSLM